VILRSEVEGRTSILSLVPEGARVKQGDLLVELDASLLLDTKIDQEIKVQNDKAAFIGARENLAVVVNQAQSDIDIAKLTLEFAELDLKKYLEGEYPNLRKEAQAKITLAEEELARAEEKLKWSTRLFDEKYISQTELQADQLAASKAKLELELAKNNLTLLENFTYKRNLSQLNSDVKQAEMALERTERKAKADVAQAEADLKAKESEYNRQQDKLQKTEEQIEKAKIYAPADGPAIYATSARRGSWRRSSEPLDVGQEVKERQELIYLPTTSSVKAEVDIHEASLKKVQVGLPAVITVDALPGKTFLGHLAHIAPLPDAQYMWMNPDLKVYNAEIYLDANDSALRTGMSCKAEIIIDQYEDATYIPVQAVLRISGEPTVYVVDDKTIEPRKVEIGLDNNIVVRIMSGLAEGEVVLLTPPLKSAALEPSAERVATETGSFENEEIYKTINDRLKENADKQQYKADDGRPGSLDRDSASPRRRQRMGKKFEDMSAEERKKMRERFRNMSPEDREKMRQQREGANK
jgi:HlyD family secretion protein